MYFLLLHLVYIKDESTINWYSVRSCAIFHIVLYSLELLPFMKFYLSKYLASN